MGKIIRFKTDKILQKKVSIFWKNLRQKFDIFLWTVGDTTEIIYTVGKNLILKNHS